MTAIKKLQSYESALAEWKRRKGPEGQGGSWNATQRKYHVMAMPAPEAFGLTGYELALAEKIKARVLV